MIIGRTWFKKRPHYRYALQVGEVNRFVENLYVLYDGKFPEPIEQLVYEIVNLLDDKEAQVKIQDPRLRSRLKDAMREAA